MGMRSTTRMWALGCEVMTEMSSSCHQRAVGEVGLDTCEGWAMRGDTARRCTQGWTQHDLVRKGWSRGGALRWYRTYVYSSSEASLTRWYVSANIATSKLTSTIDAMST